MTKADQGKVDAPADIAQGAIEFSLRDGRGVERLRSALRVAAGQGEGAEGSFSARQRHCDALRRVGEHLAAARRQLSARAGELVAEDLRLAQQVLSEITGEFRSDDLLGAIFSTFCIGK
jgi:tRNA modification GTPase